LEIKTLERDFLHCLLKVFTLERRREQQMYLPPQQKKCPSRAQRSMLNVVCGVILWGAGKNRPVTSPFVEFALHLEVPVTQPYSVPPLAGLAMDWLFVHLFKLGLDKKSTCCAK